MMFILSANTCFRTMLLLAAGVCATVSHGDSADGGIDASDPTKIYSYAGAGYKFTDFTNGESLSEFRISGNLGFSATDMVLFELGYGSSGQVDAGDDSGFTNARARWFHIFNMDYSVASGYRGVASQVDMQLAGDIVGTDGANNLALGAVPAFGLSPQWSFFLPLSAVINWDKDFDKRRGSGVAISPLLVYVPNWWAGSYVQIWPTYTRFVEGDIGGEGGANLDLTIGGAITDTVLWSITGQKNFDQDFNELKQGVETGYGNDWNVFASISAYF
ncbi:hypothetical protein [Agaribacterium haliotis]|uniref:hypothetical protein n=1 Tax=Agaribacterium haliotis TaxID=2013869 RepID=UPI000BB53BD6|nr:hypothetical protein [Agaribacterium haliotis]